MPTQALGLSLAAVYFARIRPRVRAAAEEQASQVQAEFADALGR